MEKGVSIFLVLLFAGSCIPLLAQEASSAKDQEPARQIEKLKQEAAMLQNETLKLLDSLVHMPDDLMNDASDSIRTLYTQQCHKMQAQVDSLQRKLRGIQIPGNKQLSHINEKTAWLMGRVDLIRSVLYDKLSPDQLNEYVNNIPGMDIADRFNQGDLPGLEKLSIPDSPISGAGKFGQGSIDLPNDGLSSLTAKVNEQLGKVTDIENHDWINTDLGNIKQYGKKVDQYSAVVKDPEKLDQAIDARAAGLSEFQTLSKETKELESVKQLPNGMLADLKRYQDEQALKTQAQEVAVEQATDYFSEHQDKLSEAQSMMTALKKKYSYVPDSRDLSTAVKATSLKNEPLKKRIKFGLGFQLHQTNPISLDLAPNILYRFSTLFNAGISATYRANLGIENKKSKAPNTGTDVYGISAFAQHKVWKGFFGHAEFEYLSSPDQDFSTPSDHGARRWNQGALLGIGKQMSIAQGLHGQVIFTYDFLHSEHSPNPKAWNLKFGFQLGKLNLKGIRL
jgi:hypothetical protein